MASGGGLNQLLTRTWKGRAEYDREASPAKDELKKLRWAAQGSTIRIVSNCEGIADWDVGSTVTFACVAETTDYFEGSACLSLVNTTTTPGDFCTLDDDHSPDGEDWSEFNWLCMWIHDKTTLRTTANNYKFQIRNAGVWSAEVALNINTTATTWEFQCMDISGVDRNCVDGFRFVHQRGANAGAECFVDLIQLADVITGTGNAATMGTGPVIGSIRTFPIATGSTITPGLPVTLTAGGAAAGTTDSIAVIGIACQEKATSAGWAATDTILREVLVAVEGSFVWCRGDDTGCTIGNAGHCGTSALNVVKGAGAGASGAELGWLRAMETTTGAKVKKGDQLYQIIAATTEN